MVTKTQKFLLSAALSLAFAGSGFAGEGQAQKSSEERLAQVEAELAELKRESSAAEGAESTNVSYRSKLEAKTGKKFTLKMESQLQTRFEIFDGHDGVGKAGESSTFRIRRLKTGFSGNAFGPEWQYEAKLAWTGTTFREVVETAVIGYVPERNYGFYMGKSKLPYNLQEASSSKRQQFVDRSESNEDFNQDFAQGVWVHGTPMIGDSSAVLRYWAGIYNGILKDGNDFINKDKDIAPANQDVTFLYNARAEVLLFGGEKTVGKYESDLRKNSEREDTLVLLGTAFSWFVDRDGDRDTDLDPVTVGGPEVFQADITNFTLDGRVHVRGFSLNAAFFHNTVDFDGAESNGVHPNALTNLGGFVQLGYNHNLEDGNQLEGAFRLSHTDWDEFDDGGIGRRALHSDIWEYMLGVNYRINKEKLKLSGDIGYITESDVGGNEDPSWQYRFQVQVIF